MSSISVVVPMFNSREFIGKTLDSILSQTVNIFEILIYDDASTDDSCNYVKLNYGHLIKLIEGQKNTGVGVAREILVNECKGDIVAFCDADDVWHESKLEKQLDLLENNKAIVACSYSQVTPFGALIKKIVKNPKVSRWKMYLRNEIPTSGVLIKRCYLSDVVFPNLRKRQDYALWLKVIYKHDLEILNVEEPLFDYYVRSESLSSNKFELVKWNYSMWNKELNKGILVSVMLTFLNIISAVVMK
jgi:teichuronic acid biosynthesis glycosyltransferase TuaG